MTQDNAVEPVPNAQPSRQMPFSPLLFATQALVVLLPAIIGWLHLFVHPLLPPPAADAGKHRIAVTFPLVFLSCMAASVALGLLGVKRSILWALVLACISIAAHMVSDGLGACFGFIWAVIPFWPLIGLGKFIRVLIARRV